MGRKKKEKPNHGKYHEIKITIGKNPDGSLIRKSFYSSASKEDARKKAEDFKINAEVANRTGQGYISKNITFEEWALKWLEVYKKNDVCASTYITTYSIPVHKHLIPHFGKMCLKDIKQIYLKQFFIEKTALSESVLSKLRMILNAIFETAIDNDLCIKNPAKSVSYTSTREKNQKKVYTDAQISIVKQYAADKMPEVIILLETGLRKGELLGLRWEDIDFKNKSINVKRSISESNKSIVVRPPKHNSYRTNPLSTIAIETFKKLSVTDPDDYIFGDAPDRPQFPTIFSRKLQRFMSNIHANYDDIPELTSHELRHTYGTMLRRQGVDIYTIQKVLGHKDIKMTSETYVHNELEVLREAIFKAG